MRFTLQTGLLLFVVLGSSLAVFGAMGVLVFAIVLVIAIALNKWKASKLDLFVSLLIILLLAGLVLPSLQSARECSRIAQCSNNLHQVGLALLEYEASHHSLPPTCIRDKNGKPMHSWRVLILPYLGRRDLYDAYKFDEPWDGPTNKKLLDKRPSVFACPSSSDAFDIRTTSYLAVVGHNTLWQSGRTSNPVPDQLSGRSVIVCETSESGIRWTEPRDFSLDTLAVEGVRATDGQLASAHGPLSRGFFYHDTPRHVWVAMADGSVQLLPVSVIEKSRLRDLLSAGKFDSDEIVSCSRGINWTNCAALAVWLASVGLLFYRAWRSRKKPVEIVGDHSESC
ncbi:MAG: DUF1559 domain-containing protein [Thermoguttaceae bacterium]